MFYHAGKAWRFVGMSKKSIQVELTLGGWTTDVGSLPTGDWRVFKPALKAELCTKCWLCELSCPEGVISKTDTGPRIDYDYCKGCGVCAKECRFKAIEMVRE